MNDNTSYREKGRAVFLAAIMVLSVVAMSVAFAGSAAAAEDLDNLQVNGEDQIQIAADDTRTADLTFTADGLWDGEGDSVLTLTISTDDADVDFGDVSDVSVGGEDADEIDSASATMSGDDIEVTLDPDGTVEDVDVALLVEDADIVADGGFSGESSITVDPDYADGTDGDETAEVFDDPNPIVEVDNDPSEDLEYVYDGSVAWQGQDVIAYGTDLNSANFESGDEVELRQVNSFQEDDTSFEAELTVRDASEVGSDVVAKLADEEDTSPHYVEDWQVVVIETDGLDSEYYYLADEDLPAQSTSVNSDQAFEITVQSLDVEFDDDSVTDAGDGSVTEVEIDSNRGSWYMNVSADGDIDADDLEDIFGYGALTVDTVDDDEDRITLSGVSDGDYEIDFDGIDTGDYDFEFNVTDTEASAADSISVVEEDVGASFSQGVYTQSAGDYQQFTIEFEDTDEAWIQIGDEDSGFADIVYVADDSDNDEASFWVNTRLLGDPAYNESPASDAVYWSDDDDVESLFHGQGDDVEKATFLDDDDPINAGDAEANYSAYLQELDLIANDEDYWDQLVRPLQPTDYRVTASSDGVFVADGGESEADNELDAATLDLVSPEMGEINTYVAPAEDADDADLEELLTDVEMTPRTEVAEGDRLIIEVEATGLYGALGAASGENFGVMSDGTSADGLYALTDGSAWEQEGINLDVIADDAIGNQDPTSLDLNNDEEDEIYVLVDNENGAFYVVANTDDDVWDGSLDTPHEFDVEFEYETDNDDRYRFDSPGTTSYPYFGADSDESVSTSFDVADPAVAFDNLDADDNVQIENSESATVSGETNVAPGSDADVRFRNAGDTPSFLSTPSAEIDSDGSFVTEEVDFSDRSEDDEASITFRVGGSSVDSADGIFVESVEETDDEPPEEDDEPPETDDEPPETDDEPPETDDDPAPPTDDTADDTEDDGVPGFGLAIAVVALLAAAMLALRRQN